MALQDMRDKIEHVVHLMFENRGFDTLLGWLYNDQDPPLRHVPPLKAGQSVFEGVPHDAAGNPTVWLPDHPSFFGDGPYLGGQRFIHKGNWSQCNMPVADPGEPWEDVTQQIFGPYGNRALGPSRLMRGFWLNYQKSRFPDIGSPDDILATSTRDDLRVINTLARAFAVSDHWHASAPTETNPNRAFSLAGTSQGRKINCSFNGVPFQGLRTIFGVLNDANKRWKLYADHYWMDLDELYYTQYMFPEGMEQGSFGSIDHFRHDVHHDKLPVFSYIEPSFFGEIGIPMPPLFGNDYHPPGSLYDGESTLKRVYDILISRPEVFKKTLFIVTFDEHGGTYDHVIPPAAFPPDDLSPEFNRYGLRVPTLLISPWVPPSCVFRPLRERDRVTRWRLAFDHTSVLATLMRWLGIRYTKEGDPGWLGRRTRSAQTFEDVITSTYNGTWPAVERSGCSDFQATGAEGTVGATNIPRGVVGAMVERITAFPRTSPEHETIFAEILATTRTEDDLRAHFVRLKRLYGHNRRTGNPDDGCPPS
jgi:phospholipase C